MSSSSSAPTTTQLDSLHHIAVSVPEIAPAVEWYRSTFQCDVAYQDETWAMLQFANIRLALVIPDQHPPHIAVATPSVTGREELCTHRDGTRSVYTSDVAGNVIELMDPTSLGDD